MDTGRLEAFSDGVFAIAVTLLVLDVGLSSKGTLARQLEHAWPAYVSFAISFVTIGIMWANHHAIFRLIDRVTHGLIVLNLLLLLCVSFLPFPTRVLGQHLQSSSADQRTAALFYSGSFLVTALIYNALWQTAAWRNRLIVADGRVAAAHVTRLFKLGPPSYLLATIVAIWSMPVSVAIAGGIAVMYILPRPDSDKPVEPAVPPDSRQDAPPTGGHD